MNSAPRSHVSATDRVATGKDFDANGRFTGKNTRVVFGQRRCGAGAGAADQPAVDGDGASRRSQARASRSSVHDLHDDAGGQPETRVLHRAARCRPRRDCFRTDHISYHRTDSTTLSEKALGESAAAIREMFGDYLLLRSSTVCDQGEERTGGARSDSSRRLRRDTRTRRAERRRHAPVRTDLEADHGVTDGGRTRASHDGRNHRLGRQRRTGGVHRIGEGDRVRRLPPRLRRRQ